tara:strand:+ start:4952 stop:5986 length:1035 start_codon:yes stop_codon:yes gene_type:complete
MVLSVVSPFEYGVSHSQREMNELKNIQDRKNPFGKTTLVNDVFRFNWKMIKYDKTWEKVFPQFLCKEMVEEILNFMTVYDLRFLYPNLWYGLQLKLFRLPHNPNSLLKQIRLPNSESFNHHQQTLLVSCFKVADKLYIGSTYDMKDIVDILLTRKTDPEFFARAFMNVLQRRQHTKEEGTYLSYEDILRWCSPSPNWDDFPELYQFLKERQPFLEPLLKELPDLYKKEPIENFNQVINQNWKTQFLHTRLKVATLSMYRGEELRKDWNNGSPIYYSPLLRILTEPDWNTKYEKSVMMENIRRFFDDNQLRYYCRGVLKGTGFSAFPKSWTTKKFKVYLWKYQGL